MVMALGGRAAEEVVFEVVSSGAQNDLERVTKMAYAQVTDFGFSAAVGPLSFGSSDDNNTLYKPFSERTAQLIDGEAQAIVEKAYERAISLLTENKAQLTALAEALLAKEVIGSEDLIEILGPRPHSKSVDYDAFINAAWESPSTGSPDGAPSTADAAGEGGTGVDEGGGGAAAAAAMTEVSKDV